MFDTGLEEDRGFVGNVGGLIGSVPMDPQEKTVGAVIGRPEGCRFRLVVVLVCPGAIHVRGVAMYEGIEFEDNITTGIGGMCGECGIGRGPRRSGVSLGGRVGWLVGVGPLVSRDCQGRTEEIKGFGWSWSCKDPTRSHLRHGRVQKGRMGWARGRMGR